MRRTRSPDSKAATSDQTFDANETKRIHKQLEGGLAKFGHKAFRAGQVEAMTALMRGENVITVFPTGSGKSLIYQLPATLFPPRSLTVVISPMIALMIDQVTALRALNISADSLGSHLTDVERCDVKRRVADGTTTILFVAPEQLLNESTRNLILQRSPLELGAVDEAHAVSEYGESFRPDYLRVSEYLRETFKCKRIVALTATATPEVITQMCENFAVPGRNVVKTGVFRSNLKMQHFSAADDAGRRAKLLQLLRVRPHGKTIVYVTRQEDADQTAEYLRSQGFPSARPYHAGMAQDVRKANQEFFSSAPDAIICATIAFGLGINVPNVRNVIHAYISKSLEGLSQEIGRAGRDGQPSWCSTIFVEQDLDVLEGFSRCDMTSLAHVHKFLQTLFCVGADNQPAAGTAGDSLSRDSEGRFVRTMSIYTQARERDMSETMLRMLPAWLDITHRKIESLSSIYETYKLKPLGAGSMGALVAAADIPQAGVRDVIATQLNTKAMWSYLDIASCATAVLEKKLPGLATTDAARSAVVSAVNAVERAGAQVIPSGVSARFRFAKQPTPAEIAELAKSLYQRLCDREQRDLQRLRDVVNLVCEQKQCQWKVLCSYFGEQQSATFACGNCSVCAKQGIARGGDVGKQLGLCAKDVVPDGAWRQIVAAAEQHRHVLKTSPRLLVRFAFGSKCNSLTKEKLVGHPSFGILIGKCSFEAALQKAEGFLQMKDSALN